MPDGAFNTSDGCTIAYTLHPARDPHAPQDPRVPRLVFIHSLALDRSIWSGVASRLAGDAHVLTYDCRGHGRSTRRAISFTPELFARDLAELLDHVGWPSALGAG